MVLLANFMLDLQMFPDLLFQCIFRFWPSGVLIKMTNSSEELEKCVNSGRQGREDSEYVRLVISNEARTTEAEILQPRAEARIKSLLWWVKALVLCVVAVILLLFSLKWGVPFVFEKVLSILNFLYPKFFL